MEGQKVREQSPRMGAIPFKLIDGQRWIFGQKVSRKAIVINFRRIFPWRT